MGKILIAGSARTPIGIYDGKLKTLRESDLAVLAVRDALERSGLDGGELDEVIVGVAKQTSAPSNIARYIGLAAEIPERVPAYTVQRQGASGMQALVNGFLKIKSGSASVILAGGAESMSQIPYEIQNARYAFDANPKIVFDPIAAMVAGGQPGVRYGALTLRDINDKIAAAHGYTEADQQAIAVRSIARAKASALDEALTPAVVKSKKSTDVVTADELYPAVGVLAGAADAAAMCVLLEESAAQRYQVRAEAELVSVGVSAGDPAGDGMAGAAAMGRALKKAGKTAADMELIEINETTAAQTLAAIDALELPEGRWDEAVNVHGGGLVTGNPWGAAGPVVLHRLLRGLRAEGKAWGLAVCGAEGGQAVALVVKLV